MVQSNRFDATKKSYTARTRHATPLPWLQPATAPKSRVFSRTAAWGPCCARRGAKLPAISTPVSAHRVHRRCSYTGGKRFLTAATGRSTDGSHVQLADVHSALREPHDDARPMMRWWWFGPDVRRADVDRQLDAMARAGLGGVEVAYVYPLDRDSPAFLSQEFLDELRHAAERARELGLRFDLTLTSGWPFGGPHISDEHASRGIVWERRSITPGSHRLPTAAQWPGDRLIAAAVAPGDIQEPLHNLEPLVIDNGDVLVPAGNGPRQVVLGFIRPTGQVVKRASAGAEGPALDHYSAEATLAHLDAVGQILIDAVPAELIGSFFCDSLEVYGANWTPKLPAEFARRRGYDLMQSLHLLAGTDEPSRVVRADFHRTLAELFEENFVRVCAEWCHERGVPFRIQSYGVPPARPSSYRPADCYEGEGWGWKTLTATRWASSAAHIDGTNVVSAEAWTWVHSPSFRATPLDLKGEAHEHFLSGVNHLIGHGWPYSPVAADGQTGAQELGWFFYASGALDDRNAWWPAMPQLTRYLQRLCALLRLGSPSRDVLVHLPLDDLYAELGDELDLFKSAQRRLPADLFAAIRENGRDFDLFDDGMIDDISPQTAGVVIVASAHAIDERTAQWLQRVTDAGGVVIALDSPDAGGRVSTIADLPALLDEVCRPSSRIAESNPAVGTVTRRGTTTDLHLVVNTGPRPESVNWSSSGERERLEVWNPETGDIVASLSTGETETIHLEPYGALLVVETDESSAVAPRQLSGTTQALRPVGGCTVTFPGEDAHTVTLPHRWEDDHRREGFSGTARYRLQFDVPADVVEHAAAIVLRFGDPVPWPPERAAASDRPNSYRVLLDTPIGEVAQISVNGQAAGVVWAPPYASEILSHLRPGSNTVEISVSNTTAPALAHDDASIARAAKVRHQYGERFRYQDIERAMDDVRSGLLCVPTLEVRAAGD